VSALRGLAVRAAEEDDAPRLAVLLAEAFCAVYLALLGWALAARDAHLLYRLAAHSPEVKAHSSLFGGGVRRLLTTAPAPPPVIITFIHTCILVTFYTCREQRYLRYASRPHYAMRNTAVLLSCLLRYSWKIVKGDLLLPLGKCYSLVLAITIINWIKATFGEKTKELFFFS
jgi:hypothetical protein